jgi:benzoate-CoA ligase family protein
MYRVDIPERLNIADYFLTRRLEEGAADRIALRLPGRDLTYSEVEALAGRSGRVLRQLGVRSEDRVMIALPDGADWVGAFFGVLKLGGVVVMVNPGLKLEPLAALIDYVEPRLVLAAPETGETFSRAAAQTSARPSIASVGGSIEGAAPWDDLAAGADGELEALPRHRDDAAIWLFSGGTTGVPKGVVQRHGSFVNTTELYAKRALGYGPEDVTLSVPKLYFGYATGSNLLFPFAVGASAVLFPEHPTAEILFERIARYRPTVLVNVPTMINQMVGHPGARRQNLSCLRFATSAGEALPAPLYERWKEVFAVELLDGLGTAEMWHIFVTNRPGRVKPGTLGQPVEGFDVKVADDEGVEVAAGEIGKLWVRGASLGLGYWRHAEKTAASFRGEWFVGGDLVSRDAEGYVTYCGRGDDVLKVSGKWLAPQEVESCLMRHPAVRECAVVGIENAQGLTKPVAFVTLKAEATEDELKRHVLDRLDAYKHPRQVITLDEMPRTHLGKIDRGRLKELAA